MQSAARTWLCRRCCCLPKHHHHRHHVASFYSRNVTTQVASVLAATPPPSNNSTTKSSSSSSSNTSRCEFNLWERMDRSKTQARSLLQQPKLTIPSDFVKAKRCLDAMRNIGTVDTETVGLALSLLWKVIEDAAITRNATATAWSCEPRFFNSIFNLWKKASRQQLPTVKPAAFLQKLQELARKNPAFRYDISTFAILMNVIVCNEAPERAPLVAQGLLDLIKSEAEHTKIIDLNPNEFIYSQCCFAWANSGLPEAPEQLNKLLRQMRRQGFKLNKASSSILLKFWARKGDAVEMEGILQSMEEDGVPTDIHSLSHCFQAYINLGDTTRSEELLNDIMKFQSKNILEDNVQRQCVIDMLNACRKKVMEHQTPSKKEFVEQAERIVEQTYRDKPGLFVDKERNRALFILMDIFAKTDEMSKAERMVEEAETFLEQSLADETSQLNLNMFNVLLLVYSRVSSKRPDAVQRAFNVFRLLQEHPKCKEQLLCPDINSFHSLLSCLFESNDNQYGQQAKDLLDDVERRLANGESQMKPSEIFYILTIKINLMSGNMDVAEEVLIKMIQSGIVTDVCFINEILHYWNSVRAGQACARVSLKTLREMQQIDGETSSVPPDEVTYNNVIYNILFSCSKLTNDGNHDWMENLWNVYEEMREKSFSLKSSAIFVDCICSKANADNVELMERAMSLMKDLEKSDDAFVKPDHRHYISIVKGWLKVGDLSKATSALVRSVEVTSLDQAKPNQNVISLITERWIDHGDLEQASLFLEKMKSFHDDKLLPRGPTTEIYERMSNAWTQSAHAEKSTYIAKLNQYLTLQKVDLSELTDTDSGNEENLTGLSSGCI